MEDQPVLGQHLFWIWKAFTDLNYRRSISGGGLGSPSPLPFPYTEIEAYCSLKGIYSLGERERLLRFLDALDREWMRLQAEQAEKDSASKNNMTPPPPSHSPPRDERRRPTPRTPV